jgi:hypothetical protein
MQEVLFAWQDLGTLSALFLKPVVLQASSGTGL